MHKGYRLPHNFFDWILLVFVIGSMTLTGYGQLKLIGIMLAGCYAFYLLIKKLWIPQEMIVLFAWVLWAGSTGYIVSVDNEAFMNTYKVVVQMLIMTIAISGVIAYRTNLNILFIGLLVGGILLFLSSVISGELFNALDPTARLQAKGGTDNPNDYAYKLLICSAALLYFWNNGTLKFRKIFIVALLIMIAFGIILSASRKSFMGFIMLILLWQFFCFYREIFKKPYMVIFVIILLGSIYWGTSYMLSNTYMGVRFEKEMNMGPEENKRVTLYEEGIEYIKKNPLFGIGLGNFAVKSRLGKESHSDYIEVASSTGIIGAMIYFSIYILLWKRLSRLHNIINNNTVHYNIGLFKAIVIVILLIATGRPNITSQVTWVILSGIIGYTWALGRELSNEKLAPINAQHTFL